MARVEVGEKRRCLSCATPFFDLNRTPIVCPKCAAVFQVVEVVRSSAKYTPSRKPDFKRPAPAAPVEDEAVLLVDDEEDEGSAIAATEQDDDTEDDRIEDDIEDAEAAI
jgi:uncharacterized protein (TIGR02300 family)